LSKRDGIRYVGIGRGLDGAGNDTRLGSLSALKLER
jgi:hypothetical protein